jgi:hypothetical protein
MVHDPPSSPENPKSHLQSAAWTAPGPVVDELEEQGKQVLGEVAPRVDEYVLFGHFLQYMSSSVEYSPGPQGMQ